MPDRLAALVRYPLLHKFLNLRELAATGAAQVLCCDCDTVFFDDVAALFDRYGGPDLVAREEVHSSRSAYGVDREFIDEPLLARLAASEGGTPVAPFNLGVVLLNNGVARRMAGLDALFVDYAWRLVCWMAQHPADGPAAAFGEFRGAAAALGAAGPADLARALPYPSVNRWILDEVALWLALGHVPGLRTADFDPRDVAQNGEFDRVRPTLCRMDPLPLLLAEHGTDRRMDAARPDTDGSLIKPPAGGIHGGEAEAQALTDHYAEVRARAEHRVP